jgi:hypothetical protein
MTLLAAGIVFVVLLVPSILFFIEYSKTKRTLFLAFGIVFIVLITVVAAYSLTTVLFLNAIE